jgi:hypothetical protein
MKKESPKELRMLAPDSFREKLSRRAFLQGGTALAGFALIAAACGNSSSDDGATINTADAGSTDGLASGDWSRVINTTHGATTTTQNLLVRLLHQH